MKLFNVAIIILLTVNLFPEESPPTIVLKNGLPLGHMMEENDIFVKTMGHICLDVNQNSLFLSDRRKGRILQVDIKNGKLIKAISSLGQGPTELQCPQSLVVRNGKVFVMDEGSCGVKIFTVAGAFVNSFKLRYSDMEKSFDVNACDEIFVPEDNPVDKTLVSVYSLNGKRLRGLVHGELNRKDALEYLRQQYNLRLDRKGNIYLLFNLYRQIKKYDSQGRLLWEKKISNKILDECPHDDRTYVNKLGGLNSSSRVHDLEIDDSGRVYIIHSNGGCVMDENGNVLFLIVGQSPDYPNVYSSLFCISISRGYLINQTLFTSDDLRLYKIMEDKK
jgi:hypothetical protein